MGKFDCAPILNVQGRVSSEMALAVLHTSHDRTRHLLSVEAMHPWSSPATTIHPNPHQKTHHVSPDHQTHHEGSHSSKPHRVEANDYILDMCTGHVNQKLGAPPSWIRPDYRDPPPNLQCASTASNVYRMVLKESHCISANDDKSYRWLDQVSVQKFMHAMEDSGLAKRIPRSQVKPGDCVIGEFDLNREPGNSYRHVGFVGHETKGRGNHDMVAYSNACGTFRKQELNDRFGHYKHEYFLRLYLPKFHHQST